jgi:hypothetical protein
MTPQLKKRDGQKINVSATEVLISSFTFLISMHLLATDLPPGPEFCSTAKITAPDISLSIGSVIFVEVKAFRENKVRLAPAFL